MGQAIAFCGLPFHGRRAGDRKRSPAPHLLLFFGDQHVPLLMRGCIETGMERTQVPSWRDWRLLTTALAHLVRRTAVRSWRAVRRGVPRSPNRYLDQLRGRRQLNLGGREVESNCLFDAAPRFFFGPAGRSAPWQLRTHCGVTLSLRIILQDHSEPHSYNIAPSPLSVMSGMPGDKSAGGSAGERSDPTR